MYKCHACGKQFIGGDRINPEQIWQEYLEGKQTLVQLSNKHSCSVRTIQRKLNQHKIEFANKSARQVIILMDTTYWGRNFGVILFKDGYTKENLLKYYVKTETNKLYKKGIAELISIFCLA